MRGNALWAVWIFLMLVFLSFGARAAKADPSNVKLAGVGLGMALPAYVVGVGTHEYSHAGMAKLLGAKNISVNLIPHFEPDGTFYFGLTNYDGKFTDREEALISVAPKLTDLLLIIGYSSLVLSDNLPQNKYAQLALAEIGTSATVDFVHDIHVTGANQDQVKFFNGVGLKTEKQRLPVRVLQGALTVGSAVVLYRGYKQVFTPDKSQASQAYEEPKTFLLPLANGAF